MSVELSIKDPGREQELFVGRAITLFALVVILFAILVARMLTLQIVEHETYQLRADNNRTQIQTLAPSRGMIYDRNGRLLADNQTSFSLAIVAERVEDIESLLSAIVEILSLNTQQLERIREELAKRSRPDSAVVILEALSEKQVALLAVNRHRLSGIEVVSRLIRSYPMGAIAAHAVGSVRRLTKEDLATIEPVQYSGSQFIGKRGVEAFYEKSLHGKVGYQKVETDAYGRVRRVLDVQGAQSGQNLTLHLDSKLQAASVDALDGRRGAIVALDPTTGGVLAMVSQPSYDPNLFVSGMSSSQFSELSSSIYLPLFNRAVNGQYAPGSTFKPVVGLAGISSATTDWDETIEDKGWFKLPGQDRVDVLNEINAALGDLFEEVQVEVVVSGAATRTPPVGPWWNLLQTAARLQYPNARLTPAVSPGATDARFMRQRGAEAFGFGLMSEHFPAAEISTMLHGVNERIDLSSLAMMRTLWQDLLAMFAAETTR